MRRRNPATVTSTERTCAPSLRRTIDPAGEILSALQRANGTVTEFLEQLAGEPIDADIRSQRTGPAGHDNPLGLDPGADLVRRAALLTGRDSGRRFVYAESAIALERLPASARQRLLSSRDPIGRVLTKHRLDVGREPLAGPAPSLGPSTWIIDLLDGAVHARCYLMTLGGDPAIVVSEWFLQTVAEALTMHAAARGGPNDPPWQSTDREGGAH
jgi:chorismate-pyruvate lyase